MSVTGHTVQNIYIKHITCIMYFFGMLTTILRIYLLPDLIVLHYSVICNIFYAVCVLCSVPIYACFLFIRNRHNMVRLLCKLWSMITVSALSFLSHLTHNRS